MKQICKKYNIVQVKTKIKARKSQMGSFEKKKNKVKKEVEELSTELEFFSLNSSIPTKELFKDSTDRESHEKEELCMKNNLLNQVKK